MSAKCSIKSIKCARNKTYVVILSSHITDKFYETHLIDVPLDLFNPARKEEEYCSLDRKENIQLKKKDFQPPVLLSITYQSTVC